MPSASIKLFRDLLRQVRRLPKSSREYYRVHIRENYRAHDDETDPDRLASIIDKARGDADWVVKKVLSRYEARHKGKLSAYTSQLLNQPAAALQYAGGGGVLPASLRAPFHLGLWTLASSALIMLNKRLLVDDGFAFPLALTAAGQAASFAMGCLAASSGLAHVGKPPPLAFFFTRLLPVAACSAGTLFLGNVAYLHLSVAFIQILKAATPAITLCVCAACGLQRATPSLALSVLLILGGTALATAAEAASSRLSWIGMAAFLASACLEGVRMAFMQALLSGHRYSATESLLLLAPPTGLLLAGASLLWEAPGLRAGGLARVAARPAPYAIAVLLGWAVNMTTAQAIQATSGLTFKVIGCVKNVAVIGVAVLLGDALTAWQAAGFAVSTAGFLLYGAAQQQQQQFQEGTAASRRKRA